MPQDLMRSEGVVRKEVGHFRAEEDRSEAGACFDVSEKYRFLLWRDWSPASKPRVLFVMLNPSTATHEKLDPTVRGCKSRAESWGFGSLEVCNIFALRSTDPRGLKSVEDPVHPSNDDWLVDRASKAEMVVAAWGTHGSLMDRHVAVLNLLKSVCDLYCLKVTLGGFPGHPLYIPQSTRPTILQLRSSA